MLWQKFVFILLFFSTYSFATEIQCPQGSFQGIGKPEIVTSSHGSLLIVCGIRKSGIDHTEKHKDHFSGFDVYSISPNGKYSKSLLKRGELTHYFIKVTNGGLRFEELINQAGDWLPGFSRELICAQEKCSFSNEKCIFSGKKIPSNDKLEELQSYISGRNKGKPLSDSLIDSIFHISLGGNKEAQKLFEPGHGFSLDGAAAEVYSDNASIMKRLKALQCL